MTCGQCGGTHEDGNCEVDSPESAKLLMGFLSEYRARAAEPPPPAPPPVPLAVQWAAADTAITPVAPAVTASAGSAVGPEPIAAEPQPAEPQPPVTAPLQVAMTQPAATVAGNGAPHQPAPAPWDPPPVNSGVPPWHSQPPPASPPPPTPPGWWQPPAPAPGPWGASPQPPRGGRRRGLIAGVAAAAGVALIAAAAFVVRSGGGPSYPSAWDPRVAPIAQFVSAQRGLKWKHPVKVEFLAAAKFDALMGKENAPDPQSTQDEQTLFDMMRAIGVASGNVNMAKAAQQFAQADVVGQYVDTDRTVYVRGDQLTPYVRSVLAHELTHALQAEYFDLEKMKSGHADDDSAVTALIEGDAVRVQNAYEQTLSDSDQSLLQQEEGQTSGAAAGANTQAGIPQFMIDQADFPYDFGPTFVSALVAQGGNAAVDKAFRNPPTLDGQIVDPETFVPGTSNPRVAAPSVPSGAHAIMPPSGFGEVSLLEMLGDQTGFDTAWPAVQGWMQDSFVPYRQNGRVCVSINVATAGSDAADSLVGVGRQWASHLPSASAARSGDNVHFQACDPGSAWKPPAGVDDPYQALAVRSVLIYQLITDAHVPGTAASCTADQLMTTLGASELQDAEQASDPNSPAVQHLEAALGGAVGACS